MYFVFHESMYSALPTKLTLRDSESIRNVITSYSIHYTKLYDEVTAGLGIGFQVFELAGERLGRRRDIGSETGVGALDLERGPNDA